MKHKKYAQMSFDLGLPNLRSIDNIAASFNQDCAMIVNNSENWPGNIICLTGELHSGAQTIFENWQVKNNSILVNNNVNIAASKYYSIEIGQEINEESLFSLFQLAENNKAKILVYSQYSPKNLEIILPDLQSRINSMPCFATKDINQSLFVDILDALLLQFGIKSNRHELKSIFVSQICSFVLLEKIFSHICVLANQNEMPSDLELKVILRDFAHSELNKDLFYDDNGNKSEPNK